MHPQLTALMADLHNDDLKHAAAAHERARSAGRLRRYFRHAHSLEQPEVHRSHR